METSASEVIWKSSDPEAQLAELIKQNINAIKDNYEAVQKMNDSVAKLQVVVESNTKRLDDISAEIKVIHQSIDKLNATSTNRIRLSSLSAPMEQDHVVAGASHEVSSDTTDDSDHAVEEDGARSEATFRYTFENVSKLEESQFSPPFIVRNLPWKIKITPSSTLTKEGESQRTLGCFLECNGESESTTWRCYAEAELRLISVKEGQEPFIRKIEHLFRTKVNVWGFDPFMFWKDIFDPDEGYIKDDAITLEVHVVARAPHGVDSDSSEESDHETDEDEDGARSKATFRYTVENVSKMNELQLSPPYIVRNLPWKIMVMPKSTLIKGQPQKSLGFFLQCNGESESTTWCCYAKAELRLLSVKEGQKPFIRKIQHLFYTFEDDWGFIHFMRWNDVLDPDKGYIKDDAITLEVRVVADAPHRVSCDSKTHHTG